MQRHDVAADAGRQSGFTIVELLMAVGIVGVLVVVALPEYTRYQARARAADILLKFDAVRGRVLEDQQSGDAIAACDEVLDHLSASNLEDDNVNLGIDFTPVRVGRNRGFRAVLVVCSHASVHGAAGLLVGTEARGVFAATNSIEKGARVAKSYLSFAVPLSKTDAILCMKRGQRTTTASCLRKK